VQERIVEIILFLVNELRMKKKLHEVDLSLLTRGGYTQGEISSAFTWLYEKFNIGKESGGTSPASATSFRMMNEYERMIIDQEAYGYIIQCQQLGMLSNHDLEIVFERILSSGFSVVGLAEMKSLIASFLFENDFTSGLITLGTNDTIH
jgi:uncharacterized protein Smg (DUF494 family)